LRALAAVTALLCTFAVLAPITARAKGAEHSRVQAVKVVNNASSDQYGSILRVDQPQLVARAPAPVHGVGYIETTAAAALPATTTTPETARTRGPPV
jgi:hypothetical protein